MAAQPMRGEGEGNANRNGRGDKINEDDDDDAYGSDGSHERWQLAVADHGE